MRTKSFRTFLYEYLKKLSPLNTASIKHNCKMLTKNPRMVEVLFLYAMVYEKEKLLDEYLPNDRKPSYDKFKQYFNELHKLEERLEGLANNDKLTFSDFRYNYAKIYRSYLVEAKKRERNEKDKLEMKKSILKLKEELNVSDYRLCKEVALDTGNLHSFLYKEKNNRLSYQKCSSLFRYLMKMKQQELY